MVSCIKGGINDKDTIQRRFSLLSPQQLAIIFEQEKYNALPFASFPTASFGNLPVGMMTEEQIKEMFCSIHILENERKERIAMLSVETINAILPKLDHEFLFLLSDDQVRGLDYSRIDKQHFERIFCSVRLDLKQRCHRIGLIPLQSVTKLVRIAEADSLNRLTQEQLASLDFDLLDKNQVEKIFFNWSLSDEKKQERIANLPMQAIQKLIQHGFYCFLKYLSDIQLRGLDLKNIPDEYLEELFPSLEPAHLFYDHFYSVRMIVGGVEHEWVKRTAHATDRIVYDDNTLRREILRRKAMCEKNYRILTSQQFADIRGKISPKVLEVLGW